MTGITQTPTLGRILHARTHASEDWQAAIVTFAGTKALIVTIFPWDGSSRSGVRVNVVNDEGKLWRWPPRS